MTGRQSATPSAAALLREYGGSCKRGAMDNDLAAKLDRLVFQRDITQYADRIHVLPGPGLGDRWDFCKRKLAELNQQLTVAWNDEARTHVQQELERYQKELVHIEEKLAEQ